MMMTIMMMMMMMTMMTAATAASSSAAATISGLGRKPKLDLQKTTLGSQVTAQNGSKWRQIGSGSGDPFYLLSGLGRKLIKCIKTGSRLTKNSFNQSKTAQRPKMAQNGSKMELAMA